MLQKESTPTANSNESAQTNNADSTARKALASRLTPRQRRALVALLEYPRIDCKELGRIAGQNNFAELCAGLRRKLGYDAIKTGTIEGAVDRDGQPCKPGYYALSPQGRARAVALLGGGHHA